MITALVSAITGLVSGIVPDVIKEIRDSRDHAREREFLEMQNRHYLERIRVEANSKVHEGQVEMLAEEVRASRDAMVAAITQPPHLSGVPWIDSFNAALRPLTVVFILAVFGGCVLGMSDALEPATASALVAGAIEAVLGFLFGYRAARKNAVA
jgi:hypothetical protein